MQVLQVKTVEDCFDGSFIKEFLLSSIITEAFVKKLGETGELDYFPDFPRPFFRIERKDSYQIKGVLKSKTFRVIFNHQCNSDCVSNLTNFINNMFKGA